MPPELCENLMHNIRFLRRYHKLSKKRMALILGVGVKTIAKIEENIWPPNLPAFLLLFAWRRFGIDPDCLLHHRLDKKDAPPAMP